MTQYIRLYVVARFLLSIVISINVSQDIARTFQDSLIFNRDESVASILQQNETSRMFQQKNDQMNSSSNDLCRILLIC